MEKERVVVWFSCGAASAVAAKLALEKYGKERVVIAYTDTGSEHPDNKRFLLDCEKWFDAPIKILKSSDFNNIWEVYEKRKIIMLYHGGAPCTGEMKKAVRFEFQRADDIQVFGYTDEERKRAERFREQNFEVRLETPLIDKHLRKEDCLAMIKRAGIELPVMYKMGYRNNNCIGCPKGGMGYWNKIRVDFPDVFEKMSNLERKLNAAIFKENGKPLFLDQLDPKRGNHSEELNPECSLLCYAAEQDM